MFRQNKDQFAHGGTDRGSDFGNQAGNGGSNQFRRGSNQFRGGRSNRFSEYGSNQFEGGHGGANQFGGGEANQFHGRGSNQFSGEGASQFTSGGAHQFSRGGARSFGQTVQSSRGGRGGRGGEHELLGDYGGDEDGSFGQDRMSGYKHKLKHSDYPNRKVGRYERPQYEELFDPIDESDANAGGSNWNDGNAMALSKLQSQLKQQQDMLMKLKSELTAEKQRNVRPTGPMMQAPFRGRHQAGFPGGSFPQVELEEEREMMLMEELKAQRMRRVQAQITLEKEAEIELLMRHRQAQMEREFQFGDGFSRGWGRGGRGRGGWNGNEGRGYPRGSFPGRTTERGRPGRGRGQQRVHRNLNIAKEQKSFTDENLKEMIGKLQVIVKADPSPTSELKSTIIDGAMGSMSVRTNCELKEFKMGSATATKFSACLYFDRVFLSRGIGSSKKMARMVAYDEAFDMLLNKSAEEIFNQVEPPAHSNISPLVPDDILSAVNTLQEHLREHAPKRQDNKITLLDCMVRASRCMLKFDYVDTTLRLSNGVIVHKGSLHLGGILIAEGKAHRFKDAKLDTYESGYKALISRSAKALIKGTDVEGHTTTDQLERLGRTEPGPEKTKLNLNLSVTDLDCNSTLLQKFKAMIYGVTHTKNFEANAMNNIDLLCNRVFLQPTCYYSKLPCPDNPEREIACCDLYLSCVYLATGKAKKSLAKKQLLFTRIGKLWDRSPLRKEIQLEAYNKAYVVLTTKAAKSIVENHKKLKPGEEPPGTFDKVVKGKGGEEMSNRKGLIGRQLSPDGGTKAVKEFVIVEQLNYAADRERFAFVSLVGSATANGMLLEWEYKENTEGDKTKRHTCTVYLQKEKVGEARDYSKPASRISACYEAMKVLFKTQPIIQISQKTAPYMTMATLKAAAAQWASTMAGKPAVQLAEADQHISMEMDEDVTLATAQPEQSESTEEKNMTVETLQPGQSEDTEKEIAVIKGKSDRSAADIDDLECDPVVLDYVCHRFDGLNKQDDLEEMTFLCNTDFPYNVRMAIIAVALDMGMNVMTNHSHGNLMIGRVLNMQQRVEFLKKHGGSVNGYSLLTESGMQDGI